MLRSSHRSAVAALVLGVLATLVVASSLREPVKWTPDGLFYQEHLLELRGASEREATADVFMGPISSQLRRIVPQWVDNPRWIRFNKPFYERRLAVPLAAAAIYPLAKDRSIQIVSVCGYVIAIVLLFIFLRLRFSLPVAFATTVLTIPLSPLRVVSIRPLTDSWGIALGLAALIFAVLAINDGYGWIAGWAVSLIVLGFTRDSGWIPVLGVVWLAVMDRTRRLALLAVVGICSVALAPLIFEVPFRDVLAFTLNHAQVPGNPSWSFIAHHYPGAVIDLVRANVGYLRRGQWYTAGYMVGGVILLFALTLHRESSVSARLLKAMTPVALAYVLILPNFTAFRLELVFLPMAAYGVALLLERLLRYVELRRAQPTQVTQ